MVETARRSVNNRARIIFDICFKFSIVLFCFTLVCRINLNLFSLEGYSQVLIKDDVCNSSGRQNVFVKKKGCNGGGLTCWKTEMYTNITAAWCVWISL
jgi:hypothetical protein